MKKKFKGKAYRIIDSWLKGRGVPERDDGTSDAHWLLYEGDRNGCLAWIKEGLYGTEGAERDHYVDLLEQLDLGKSELDYRRVG